MSMNIGPATISPSPSPLPHSFIIRFVAATLGPTPTVAVARYELDPTGPVSFQVGPGTLAKVLARGSFAVTPLAQPVDTQVAIVPDSGAVAHAIVPILVEIDEIGPGSRPISVARRLCTLMVP